MVYHSSCGRQRLTGGGASLQLLVQTAQRAGVAPYSGAGANRHSTLHVDDLAALYVLALERAPAGTLLNAAAGAAASMKELATAVSYAIGWAGAIASWTIDDACAALGGRANFFALNHQISGARATRLLGWNPQAPSLLYDVAYGSHYIQPAGYWSYSRRHNSTVICCDVDSDDGAK